MGDRSTGESDDPSPRRAVAITVGCAEADLVADELFALGASAVSEEFAAPDRVRLVADVDPAAARERGWSVQLIDDDPALATTWHASAASWRCGERLVVRPHWIEPAGAPWLEVVLDPGEAFGAGSHPTTRLCLAALEPLAPAASNVLDVGSGTGVLGVAALLLGADRLVAIDVDPAAVEATRRAAQLNGVAPRARVSSTPLDRVEGAFDLVLANLLLPTVERLGADLVRRVAPGGSVVVGGLLAHQLDRAARSLAPLTVRSVRHDGEWVSAVLARD